MTAPLVIWVHGLEGSPKGYKASRLVQSGLDLIAPDGRGLPLNERIAGAEAALDAHPSAVLVGSSFGGLAACTIASRRPVRAALLLAPALMHPEGSAGLTIPTTTPFAVIHGVADDIVPISVSEALVRRCPHGVLHAVSDGHALAESLALIESEIRRLWTTTAPTAPPR